MWFNETDGQEEEKSVQGGERGESGVTGSAGDASAGASGGEQEARQTGEAQGEPGQAAGGCGPRVIRIAVIARDRKSKT